MLTQDFSSYKLAIVHTLTDHGVTVVNEDQKRILVDSYYDEILGRQSPRSARLDFEFLGIPHKDLSSCDTCFLEDEIWSIIRDLPSEKLPGPDGLTGLFFKTVWPIIKEDIMNALNSLCHWTT